MLQQSRNFQGRDDSKSRPWVWAHLANTLALLILALTSFSDANAQVLYGSVVGTVTDSSGAVVPGASIRLLEIHTNVLREAVTSGEGTYKISTVLAGTFTLTASKAGFGNTVLTNIPVNANNDVRIDIVLKPGAQSATVTVNADTPELQTDRADVRSQISNKEIENLPVAGRNYQSLLAVIPGFTLPQDTTGNGSVNNPARSLSFSSNGTSSSASNPTVEGVSTTNNWIQFSSTYVPSQDSIQSVDVVTGSFNAEQGLSGGTEVNVQLKSGTNAFHGSAFESYTGNALYAFPRFSAGTTKPKLVDNQFGGTFGGPILKNRLFFFTSVEAFTDRQHQSNPNWLVPDDCQRQGLFVDPVFDPNTGSADGSGKTAFDQITLGTNLNNCPAGTYYQIPQGRWDAATAKFVTEIPEPNEAPTSRGAANYLGDGPYSFTNTKYDSKVDYNITNGFKINWRISVLPFDEFVPSAYGENAGGPPVNLTGQPGKTSGQITSSTLSAVYTITPRLVLDGNIGYTYQNTNQTPPQYGVNYGTETLGIPNADGPTPINSGIPQFQFYGFPNWYGTWYSAILYHNPTKQGGVNLTWVKGTHSFRTGFQLARIDLNQLEALFAYSYFNFSGNATLNANGTQNTGYDNQFADFLLGAASDVQKAIPLTKWSTLRTTDTSLYGQDQWQVTKKLTINYGLRWNYYPVPSRDHRGIEVFNFDASAPAELICGQATGVPHDCNVDVSKHMFSPLLGVAYRLSETTVIRSGFGLNYEQQNMYRDGVYTYPNQIQYNSGTSNSYVPVQYVSQGLPELSTDLPSPSPGVYPLPANFGVNATLRPGDFKRGYVESWNLTVEQQFAKEWTASIGYVGTQTVNQQARLNINTPSDLGLQTPYTATLGNAPVTAISPVEHMSYNSMQARLNHTFSHGILIAANYTWSKWMGVCCDSLSDGQPQIAIPKYFALNRAVLPGDRTNNFNVSMVAELPFGKGKPYLASGIGSKIAGGWQTSFTVYAMSGTPFSITGDAGFLQTPNVSNQMADKVKPSVAVHPGNVNNYFDTAAFQDVKVSCGSPPCPVRFGDAGWDSVRGPGIFNTDLSLMRTFPIAERLRLQFRGDVFNLTNTPHFANPGGDVNNSFSFGTITGVNAFGGRFGIDQRQAKLTVHLEF
jgi:hypothetical protein